MRILFINRYFYPDVSATARMLTDLAEDLDAHGESVTVITGRTAYLGGETLLPASGKHKGVLVTRVGSTDFGRHRLWGRALDYLSFYMLAAWAALRLERHDCLVVLSDPPLLSVLAAVLTLVKPVKTICWLQDVYPDIAIKAGVFPNGRHARLLRRVAVWSLRKADLIVAVGRCMMRHVRSMGVPAHQMVTITNWADATLIQPVDREENGFLAEHALHDRFVVMYSGNLGRVHDLSTIVEMIRNTVGLHDICFCFVGEGYQKRALHRMAGHEGWRHVLFLPYQPSETLPFSLSAADVHLVSLGQDMAGLSIPSKIYGIMAAGRPVIFIGPEESEVAHTIKEAGCGYIVRPGDNNGAVEALLACYHSRADREQKGRAAREYLEHHCARTISTRRFWQVLQEVSVT